MSGYTGDLLSKWWRGKSAAKAMRVVRKKRRYRLAQLRKQTKRKHHGRN